MRSTACPRFEIGVCPQIPLVLGRFNLPVVHEGDALFHNARVENPEAVDKALGHMRQHTAAMERGPSGAIPIV